MPKMSKKEQDEEIDKFIKYVDNEIELWAGEGKKEYS